MKTRRGRDRSMAWAVIELASVLALGIALYAMAAEAPDGGNPVVRQSATQ